MKIFKGLLTSVFFALTSLTFAIEEPITLTSGQVAGTALESGVQAFLGIPFAAPPVGDLRWRAPQPPTPWQGVRQVSNQPPACMQRGNRYMSEDCLYLNVWTKAESPEANLPVMVWIHGGGWTSGANSIPIYNGEQFALNEVVLISVNYRMNAFGWMAHPALSAESPEGVSGNYGILDHIAALEWVRDNVAGFGGDPNNVTIFGESAGGGSVYSLLATPLAKGLFHKAISQSTWITSYNVTNLSSHNGMTASAEARGEEAINTKLDELGVSGTDQLENMRDLTAAQLMEMNLGIFGVSLIVDGHIFPKSPAEIFAEGSHNAVPLIAGVNDGEGLFFIRPGSTFETVEEQRAARVEEFGEHAGNLLDMYVADSDEDVFNIEVDYNTDSWFARPTREILNAMARTNEDSYMYLFTRNLGNPEERSPHAMELMYVFNTLPSGTSDEDWEIAKLMNDYWVEFAKSGTPNNNELPQWPVYDIEQETHQIIGVEVKQGAQFRTQELNELDRYFDDRYNSAR